MVVGRIHVTNQSLVGGTANFETIVVHSLLAKLVESPVERRGLVVVEIVARICRTELEEG